MTISRISFLTWSKASTWSKNIEAGFGDAELVLGRGGQALDQADCVVGEELPTAPAVKGGRPGKRAAVWPARADFQLLEDVALEAGALAALFHGDLATVSGHLLIRRDADEGIQRPHVFAAFDAFQQKCLGSLVRNAQEGGDRCLQIGGDGTEDRDQAMAFGQLVELTTVEVLSRFGFMVDSNGKCLPVICGDSSCEWYCLTLNRQAYTPSGFDGWDHYDVNYPSKPGVLRQRGASLIGR